MITKSRIFEVYQKAGKKQLYTLNLVPGKTVYDERLVKQNGKEYREWSALKSKLAAAIIKGCSDIKIRKGDVVLYLGAASGTTASHASDIVGRDGLVFALDFAPRVVRDLVFVAEQRPNIAPILANASLPLSYAPRICEVDVVFQDIAQRNQIDIFIRNCRLFLKKGGFGLIAVKARSIDVTKKPKQIFKQARAEIEKELNIVDYRELAPLEKDHCMFICKK